LGDYGNLTEMGSWLRTNLIPFWSWQEVNFKRYPRLILNAFTTGGAKRGAATQGLVGLAVLARMGALYASMWMWNHLWCPDEEENLSGYDRANPHVLLGSDDDGTILIFRNVGALGDWLEWYGINDLTVLWPQYASGQIDFADMATEVLKAPAKKVIGGLRPEIDVTFSLITGKSLFPDPFNPRTTERELVLPSTWGLQDEYRYLRGQPTRPRYLQRALVGRVDYRQAALTEIYDLREKFQKRKGKSVFSDWKITEWTHVRRAAAYNDKRAFDKMLKAYYASGKTEEDLLASVARMDPMIGVAKTDRVEFEEEFLNSIQRKKLAIARSYSQDVGDRIITWVDSKRVGSNTKYW
jgi:hypothetical protein